MGNLDCNIFCERARELFGDVGQIELGQKIGISQGVISTIKRGDTKAPSADTVYRIAKYFNVSADWLLGLSDVRSTDQATKELCDTLGLSELAIRYLQNENELSYNGVVNFLFAQHKKKADEGEDKIGEDRSILDEMATFLALLKAQDDFQILLRPSGEVLSLHIDQTCSHRVDQLTLKGAQGELSLVEACMGNSVRSITHTLEEIARCKPGSLVVKHFENISEYLRLGGNIDGNDTKT